MSSESPSQQPSIVIIGGKPCLEKQGGRAWKRFERILGRMGLHFRLAVSDYPGHSRQLAREHASQADLVVAAGGDGTLGEVVGGLLEAAGDQRPTLAVLPLGRGNDFYRSLTTDLDAERACHALMSRRLLPLDIGQARFQAQDGTEATQTFVNLASIGFTAEVSASVAEYGREVGGTWPYVRGLLANLLCWKNRAMSLRVDDVEVEASLFNLNVTNGRYYGGGMVAAPQACLDDGLLDVTVMRDLTRWDVLRYMPNNYSGRFEGIAKIQTLRGRCIEVRAPEPQKVQLDGDVVGTTPARFEILPQALQLAAP